MPRRSYRKRRYNRTLSKRNVYLNRSAKSQAKQIASLNRKINYVYRQSKPETKQWITDPHTYSFSNSSVGPSASPYAVEYLSGPVLGDGDDQCIGSTYKVKGVQARFYFEYYNNSQNGGYHTSESAGATIRVIAVQRKDNLNKYYSPITPSDLLEKYSSTGAGYTASSCSPLISNITKQFRVLYDKTRVITINKNQMVWRVSLRNVRPINKDKNDHDKVNNVIFFVLVSGLHADTDFSEYVTGSGIYKYAFTDA